MLRSLHQTAALCWRLPLGGQVSAAGDGKPNCSPRKSEIRRLHRHPQSGTCRCTFSCAQYFSSVLFGMDLVNRCHLNSTPLRPRQALCKGEREGCSLWVPLVFLIYVFFSIDEKSINSVNSSLSTLHGHFPDIHREGSLDHFPIPSPFMP